MMFLDILVVSLVVLNLIISGIIASFLRKMAEVISETRTYAEEARDQVDDIHLAMFVKRQQSRQQPTKEGGPGLVDIETAGTYDPKFTKPLS
jgi:F0F1-type ATP synthase membrane subunit b/b'